MARADLLRGVKRRERRRQRELGEGGVVDKGGDAGAQGVGEGVEGLVVAVSAVGGVECLVAEVLALLRVWKAYQSWPGYAVSRRHVVLAANWETHCPRFAGSNRLGRKTGRRDVFTWGVGPLSRPTGVSGCRVSGGDFQQAIADVRSASLELEQMRKAWGLGQQYRSQS